MNFEEYQEKARSTAIYPNLGQNYVYPTLGLCGESGEVAEKIKKIIRDSNGIITAETRGLLAKELGDVLWYVANLCSELQMNMDTIAQHNIEKLANRKLTNNLHGSGDNR